MKLSQHLSEDFRPLECGTVKSGVHLPVFWRNVLSPPSKYKGGFSLSMCILPEAIYSKKC